MARDAGQHYDAIVDGYAAKNSEDSIPDALRTVRDRFLDALDGDAVLDAGCGHGRDADYFARHGVDAVGVDIAPGMLDYARAHQRGDYVQGDLRALPLPDDAVDGAWYTTSAFLVPHEEQQAVVEEAARVTREDGLLYLNFKTAPEPDAHPREEFGSTVLQYRRPAEDVERLLADAGFAVERLPDSVNEDGYGLANFFARP